MCSLWKNDATDVQGTLVSVKYGRFCISTAYTADDDVLVV